MLTEHVEPRKNTPAAPVVVALLIEAIDSPTLRTVEERVPPSGLSEGVFLSISLQTRTMESPFSL